MTPDSKNPSGSAQAADNTPDKMAADKRKLADAASKEAQSAKAEAGKAVDVVKDQAGELAGRAKSKALETADQGKETVASSMGDFAAAIRSASDELGQRDQSMAANLIREVSTGLEDFSKSLQGSSLQDLTRSVAGFARRQPTTFLAGAALAGVALGRFLKASDDHDHDSAQQNSAGYGQRNDQLSSGTRYPSSPSGSTGSFQNSPRPASSSIGSGATGAAASTSGSHTMGSTVNKTNKTGDSK